MRKALAVVVGLVIFALTYCVYLYFASSGRGGDEEIATTSTENPIGMLSDGSFRVVESGVEFDSLRSGDIVTLSAVAAEPSGLYVRKEWVSATETSSQRSGRRRFREVTRNIPYVMESPMTRYPKVTKLFIVELSDGAKFPALVEQYYISKLGGAESVELPIGEIRSVPKALGAKLNIDADYMYYALDNSWYIENGASINTWAIVYAAIFFVLCMVLLFTKGKAIVAPLFDKN